MRYVYAYTHTRLPNPIDQYLGSDSAPCWLFCESVDSGVGCGIVYSSGAAIPLTH
jgi:hypothetical protein